jgi:hypothetical protein
VAAGAVQQQRERRQRASHRGVHLVVLAAQPHQRAATRSVAAQQRSHEQTEAQRVRVEHAREVRASDAATAAPQHSDDGLPDEPRAVGTQEAAPEALQRLNSAGAAVARADDCGLRRRHVGEGVGR